MAVQTVEAYAAIVDMLSAVKRDTANGECTQRCAEAFFPDEKGITDSLLQSAKRRASNYMRLAANRTFWLPHNP
jgi:hypothetical protein